MAAISCTDSVELLDFLFDQTDGILSHESYLNESGISNNYMVNDIDDRHQLADHFKTSDFGLSDCEADELLSCLTEVDLLAGIAPPNYIETYVTPLSNADSSASLNNHCHEDHLYSRSPMENVNSTSLDVPIESPSSGSAISTYSYSDTNSPLSTGPADDSYSTSSLSSGNNGQHSPLGSNMEDLTFGVCATYDQTVFVLHGDQLIQAVSAVETDNTVDDSALVSLDIVETDVESYSDDGSTGAGLDSMNDYSMFDDNYSSVTGSELPYTLHDVSSGKKRQYQKLVLSEEEKLLLAREGISIPTDVPLTKEEERALKSVRRKIRNKVSAKVSRKRKQEYVEGLEKRVKMCTQQNRQLQQKVHQLEKLNQSFVVQLKKFQAMLTVPGGVSTRQAQTGTCIMVLVMSFAFFILPNVGPWLNYGNAPVPLADKTVGPGRSRSLLTKDMMTLYSANSDYANSELDYETEILSKLPVDTNLIAVEDHSEQVAGSNSNASYASESVDDLSDPSMAIQDTAFAVRDDGELPETVLDVSKFPAKNDL